MEHYLNTTDWCLPGEEWKDIPNYDGTHQVSNLGRVRALDRVIQKSDGRSEKRKRLIKKPKLERYWRVKIGYHGEAKTLSVHRLIAEAFIPNPENKPEVNHISGVKSDNSIENLEWVTKSENIRHSIDVLGNKGWNNVPVVCIETGERFESCKSAQDKHGDISLHAALNDPTRVAGGYHWCYEKDYNPNYTPPKQRTNKIPIVCVETKEVFDSASEAAKFHNVKSTCITQALRNPTYTIAGFHWVYQSEYSEDYVPPIGVSSKKKVKNKKTGEVFESLRRASKDAGVERRTFSYRLKNRPDLVPDYEFV